MGEGDEEIGGPMEGRMFVDRWESWIGYLHRRGKACILAFHKVDTRGRTFEVDMIFKGRAVNRGIFRIL